MGSTQLRKQTFWKGNEAVAHRQSSVFVQTHKYVLNTEKISNIKGFRMPYNIYTVNTQQTTLCSKTLTQTHTLRWSWLTLRLGGSYTLFPLCVLVNSMTVCLIKAARWRVQVLRTQ